MLSRGRRVLAVGAALAASVAVAAPAALGGSAGTAGTGQRTLQAANLLESTVLVELNRIRAQHGLAPLRTNAKLRAAADTHSAAMAQFGFFAHESRDGSAFWKRVQRFYAPGGYGFWSVGENLLWSSSELSAKEAVEMWMKSPKHRENILTPRWREIGLSAVRVDGAPGVYGGLDVTIFTTDFGVRRA
jgi:uncharacterized protein YkwD